MYQCLQRCYPCDYMPGMLDVEGNVKSWHVSDINVEELLKLKLSQFPSGLRNYFQENTIC